MILDSTHIRVLCAFFPQAEPLTAPQIEKQSGYSHETVYSALQELRKENVLAGKHVGKAILYSLRDYGAAYIAFAHAALERKEKFISRYPQLKNILNEFYNKTRPTALIVFGSYSRFSPVKTSDLDLLCVEPKNDTERAASEIGMRYGVKLAPVSISSEDFPNIRQDNPELWKSLRNESIIWKGHEFFYDNIYEAMR